MSDYNITIDDKKVKAQLQKMASKAIPEIKKAIKETLSFTILDVKKTLPKRTGNLRNMYQIKQSGITGEVAPPSGTYAEAVEFGTTKTTIVKPKGGRKYLTIPNNDKALTSTGVLSQSAVSTFWKAFKAARRQGKSSLEAHKIAQQISGVTMARKATLKPRKGQYNLRDKVLPRTKKKFKKEIDLALERLAHG